MNVGDPAYADCADKDWLPAHVLRQVHRFFTGHRSTQEMGAWRAGEVTMAAFSFDRQMAALNRHDVEGFAALYARDAIVVDPQYPKPLQGVDAIRQDFVEFLRAFPDLSFSVQTAVHEGDRLAIEGTATGTHTGPLSGPQGEIPATRLRMSLPMATFLRFSPDGKVTHEHRYYDQAALMQQLGLGA